MLDMTTYSALDVAAELRRRIPGVGVKKLHKLLYYCQGHHLGTLGHPMFSEDLHAWNYGPVVASLWRTERYDDAPPEPANSFDQGTLNTIGYVISRYGSMTGADLEALTHNEEPWLRADARRGKGGSQLMPKDEIRTYFMEHPPTDDSDEDEDFTPEPAAVQAWLSGANERAHDALSRDDRASLLALAKR
jgi:uncharacterized phage-associated protein